MTKTTRRETGTSDLLAEHQELMLKVAEIRTHWQEACKSGGELEYNEMADHIADVRRLLKEHFDVELEGGYLNAVLERAPQFTEQATRLCAQHAEFLEALDGMESRLRAHKAEAWDSVREEFGAFIDELSNHEHRENEMVQTAFNQDIGVGD